MPHLNVKFAPLLNCGNVMLFSNLAYKEGPSGILSPPLKLETSLHLNFNSVSACGIEEGLGGES